MEVTYAETARNEASETKARHCPAATSALLLTGVCRSELQREFVWDGKRAAALLDSISRGMPIGVVLIWQTKPQQYDLLRHR